MLRYYIWTIIIANLFIIGINLWGYLPTAEISALYAIFATILSTIAVIMVDAIVAIVCRMLPHKWLSPFNTIYKTSKLERKFLEKLKIRKWKDKIPEMGKYLCNFDKTSVKENSSVYIYKFLKETTMAEVMHIVSAFAGFILILIPVPHVWTIVLPVVLVNFILQIPPVLIQRYNRPKLMAHYKRILKKENQ